MSYRTTRPTGLPELRAAILDDQALWKTLFDIGQMGRVSDLLLGDHPDAQIPPGLAQLSAIGRNFDTLVPLRESLRMATLWWVGADSCELLAEAAPSMPPVTLTTGFVPDVAGFAVLERPIRAVQTSDAGDAGALIDVFGVADQDRPEVKRLVDERMADGVTVDFVQWYTGMISGREGISIILWSAPDDPKQPPIPLGRSDWLFGDQTDHQLAGLTEAAHASMVEDRRIIAALWQLSAQPSISQTTELSPDRATQRRLARRGHETAPVRVVNLRPQRRRSSTRTASQEFSCRWIVRPHWRQQPYGPGRSLRKAILMRPYIKGTPGKPLRVRDVVKVWNSP